MADPRPSDIYITFTPAGDHGNAVISPARPISGVYWSLIGSGPDLDQNAVAERMVAMLNDRARIDVELLMSVRTFVAALPEEACDAAADEMERLLAAIGALRDVRATGPNDWTFHADVIDEQMDEGSGFWKACSGCQESSDGYVSTDLYPFSRVFRCQPGAGCSECGGLGVLWDNTDYEEMAAWMLADEAAEATGRASETQLRDLYRAYVNLLETGRDRIIANGGTCDPVDRMEEGDPVLVRVREHLATLTKSAAAPPPAGTLT